MIFGSEFQLFVHHVLYNKNNATDHMYSSKLNDQTLCSQLM